MTIDIHTNPNDDPQFVALAAQMISGLIDDLSPEKIYVIKIDNWFDHKWLNFSGIGRVGFFEDFRLEKDTALDEFRQKKTTLPPFTPRRVIAESHFVREMNSIYSLSSNKPYVHERKLAPSSRNLHKRVADLTHSALFVWISSNTKSNLRGSIMVYEVKGSMVHTWYAGLSKGEGEWRVLRTKGVAADRVESIIEHTAMQGRT